MTNRLSWRFCLGVACGLAVLLTGTQPAMADSIRNEEWHLRALEATTVHKIVKGEGVIVAVIDTGVNPGHRDLAGSVLRGVDLTGNGTDGLSDMDGHGTAMAGIIAGHGHGPGNADGIIGIAPSARILPIRIFRMENQSPVKVSEAVDKAVALGAKVISMSFGTAASPDLDHTLRKALQADVVLVAAVGNRPDEIFVQFPARYSGVVAVGATGRNGELVPISVTGKQVVLTAPGTEIVSTSRTGAYQRQSGTSEAAAIVAGAAALIRAKFPTLPATEVIRRLTATATDKGPPGRDPSYGFGELNLLAALTADIPPATTPQPSSASPTTSPEAAPPPGPGLRIDWSALSALLAVIVAVIVLIVWLVLRRRGHAGAVQTRDQPGATDRRGPFRGSGSDP